MKTDSVHIVGGGIIGLCTAWYLSQEGCDVTVIDKGDFTDGTSHGNAGMIVPSHFIPMAAPGVISQGLRWMLDSMSPFYIKPRLSADLMQWLWYFHRSANAQHVISSMPILQELNEKSKALYAALKNDHVFRFEYEERGLLMLFKTEKKAKEESVLVEQACSLGIQADMLDRDGLHVLEPEMDLDVKGGVYFPDDAHLYPNLLINQLVERLAEAGVQFHKHTGIQDFKVKSSKIEALIAQDGRAIPVDHVVLAAGSWSGSLAKN